MKQLLIITLITLSLYSCTKEIITPVPSPPVVADCACSAPIDSVNVPTLARVTSVFVGSSTIALWPGLEQQAFGIPIIRRGFGGYGIMDIYYRVDTAVSKYKPAQVVIYVGDNDINRKDLTDNDIVTRYKKLVDKLSSQNPTARLVFIPIKPSPYLSSETLRIKNLNAAIEKYVLTKPNTIFETAIWSAMFNDNGTFHTEYYQKNSVHLTAAGYNVWNQEIFKCLIKQ